MLLNWYPLCVLRVYLVPSYDPFVSTLMGCNPYGKDGLRAGAESPSPLYFGAINHIEMKHNETQKYRSDGQTPLTSVE